MNSTIYSQASIFHLSRLALLVAGVTGKRFKLKSPGGQQRLIQFCRESNDPSICKQFNAFLVTNGDLSTGEETRQSESAEFSRLRAVG